MKMYFYNGTDIGYVVLGFKLIGSRHHYKKKCKKTAVFVSNESTQTTQHGSITNKLC